MATVCRQPQTFVACGLLIGATLIGITFGAGTRKSFSSSFAPNFDPEFPHFTPFNAPDFIHMQSDLRVEDPLPVPVRSSTRATPAGVQPPKRQHFGADDDADEDILPFKSFVLDMYKNYRNAYLSGNQTIGGVLGVSPEHLEQVIEFQQLHEEAAAKTTTTMAPSTTTTRSERPTKVRRRFQSKVRQPAPLQPPNSLFDNEVRYNVGPGVNISVDPNKELVSVFLDEDCLKDVFTGRGRKQDLISKILPLFILPFLIQSAIVPFAVTTLKLLLVKSILVGKIAIFLLIISALKNHHSKYASYDSPPQYVVGDPPSRRSEAVGYRVEGKPTTWVN